MVALLTAAAILATFASVVPWYVDNGTLNQSWGYDTYNQYFTPGPGGYIHACDTYPTANTTICVAFSFDYNVGSGTEQISALYAGILATSVATAILACAAALTISAGLQGRIRARLSRRLVIIFVTLALCTAAVSTALLPAFQGPAFQGFASCPGFNGTVSPCTSFIGSAACVGVVNMTCVETNLSWYPGEGWYLEIASIVILGATLGALYFQALSFPCPFCGTPNRFPARYCDTCGRALPAEKEKESPGYRL